MDNSIKEQLKNILATKGFKTDVGNIERVYQVYMGNTKKSMSSVIDEMSYILKKEKK